MKRLALGILGVLLFLFVGFLVINGSKWWPLREVTGHRLPVAGPQGEGKGPNASRPGSGVQRLGSASEDIVLTAEERGHLGLKTVRVEERVIEDVFTVSGVIRPIPDLVASVSSRVAGKVIRVSGNVGDEVKVGQTLAELRSTELEKIQTKLLQAKNRLDLARADLERIRYLVERGIGARRDLLQKEAEVKNTRMEIAGLQNQLRIIGLEEGEIERIKSGSHAVSTLTLKAPISGVILQRDVTLGETIDPAKVLFRIADIRRIFAEGEAFETYAASLRKGLRVRVQVPAYPDRTFTGRIAGINYEVGSEERTIPFWVEIENVKPYQLKPNMSAILTIAVGRKGRALAIPREAVISEAGEEFVFVQEEDRFRKVTVSLGLRDDRYAEVKSGLGLGDLVVTTGKRQLYTVYRMGRSSEELEEMGSVD